MKNLSGYQVAQIRMLREDCDGMSHDLAREIVRRGEFTLALDLAQSWGWIAIPPKTQAVDNLPARWEAMSLYVGAFWDPRGYTVTETGRPLEEATRILESGYGGVFKVERIGRG